MKKITKDVFYCDHCKKHGLSRHSMKYHETICRKNPDNIHPCYTCAHFEIDEGFVEKYYVAGGEVQSTDVPYKHWMCKKQGIDLHNMVAKNKGLIEKYPEQFSDTQLMPSICDLWEIDKRNPRESDTFL